MNTNRFKFRAWHIPTKQMFDVHCFTDKEVFADIEDGIGTSPINPAKREDCILMQCIGLKDKNGKLMFEGDIVKMDADCMCADQEQVDKPCYVEFGDMAFWFIYPQLDNEHKSAGWNECAEYEIVGNIYESCVGKPMISIIG